MIVKEFVVGTLMVGKGERDEEHKRIINRDPIIYTFTRFLNKNRFDNVILYDNYRVKVGQRMLLSSSKEISQIYLKLNYRLTSKLLSN